MAKTLLIGANSTIAKALQEISDREFVCVARSEGTLNLEGDLSELDDCCIDSVDIIGVNNRNLKTFNVDIETSVRLSTKIPSNYAKISESGISNSNDIITLKNFGYDGFLIGENFMKSVDPGRALANFLNEIKNDC